MLHALADDVEGVTTVCTQSLVWKGQYTPYNAIDQAISIYAASKGFLDDIDIEHVHAFEEGLLEYMNSSAKATKEKLVESKSFKGLEDEFNTAISEYKANFTV